MKSVLFLCTGNYFRSRFAEIYFNYLAEKSNLPWRANSKGYKADNPDHIGPLSSHTSEILRIKGIPFSSDRFPEKCCEADLQNADRIIALKKTEHLPMTKKHFPSWTDKIEFWEIHDIDAEEAAASLKKLEGKVIELLMELKRNS